MTGEKYECIQDHPLVCIDCGGIRRAVAVWIPLRRKDKRWISVVGIVLEMLLAVACAYLDIALDTLLPRLPECLLAMLYTALFADAATELAFLIIRLIKKNKAGKLVRFIAGMAVTLAFLAYMVINSQIVTPKIHTYTSDKLDRDHKIVYISDLHYGSTQTK